MSDEQGRELWQRDLDLRRIVELEKRVFRLEKAVAELAAALTVWIGADKAKSIVNDVLGELRS